MEPKVDLKKIHSALKSQKPKPFKKIKLVEHKLRLKKKANPYECSLYVWLAAMCISVFEVPFLKPFIAV